MIDVKGLKKNYGGLQVLKGVDLTINKGDCVVLVGPSGCGKSTFLRCLNRLEEPDGGHVIFNGKEVTDHDIDHVRQKMGMVFQHFNLFPHLTVKKNITLAPVRLGRMSQAAADKQAMELLERIGLADKADVYPNMLSGGQKQRIAIVRALAMNPEVLLFDEPLSNLDAKLRESMRDELRALQKRLGITSLYVTHDQSEAMAISDRVVIMKDGVICQQGTPTEIYEQPNSRFVANFIGKANFIDGTFRGMDGENALVEVGGHTFPIPAPGKMEGVQKDGPCCLAVRPESILLSEEEGPLSGRVSRATYYGAKVEYEVMLGDQPIIVEVYNPQLSKRFAEGEAVHMTLIDRCVRVLA